jgi:hypothetical protein
MLQLEVGFEETVHAQNSVEQWTAWLKGIVAQMLKPYKANQTLPKLQDSSY